MQKGIPLKPVVSFSGTQQGAAMDLSTRVFIVSLIDISVTDSVAFIHLKQHPENLTILFLVGLILITLLPILLTLIVWRTQKAKK